MQYLQQAWAALVVKPRTARWERHTPCCWRGQVEVRHWESWGKSESTVAQKGAGHKSTGNQAIWLALLLVELCVSLRSAPDLELVSLHWLRHSSQGGQPEFTRTMTLKCTYRDLHNTGVWILPEPPKEGECNMSTLLVLFQDTCTNSSAGPHTDFSRCGKIATLNYPSFLTLVEKEGVIKYLGKSSNCQLDSNRHQKRLDGDNFRKKLSQDKGGWGGNPRKDVLLGQW